MANEGSQSRNRRMDLNLYLGLPHSPLRRGSDLGSDLALGSILISGEQIHVSREMNNFVEASDAHSPYSPSHASYTPNAQAVESFEQNPQFEYSSPHSIPSSLDPVVQDGRSNLGYSLYSPTYTPISATEETIVEPLGDDTNDTVRHVPYSPSYTPISSSQDNPEPVDEINTNTHLEYVPYSPSYTPVVQSASHVQTDELLVFQESDSHASYAPSFVSGELIPQVHNDNPNGESSSSLAALIASYEPSIQRNDPLVEGGSSEQELLQHPEVRFRRLIESNRRWPIRRFRSTVPYTTNSISSTSLSPLRIFQELMASERSAETSGDHIANLTDLVSEEDIEEDTKEERNRVANFECNICLDMAKEPVVTSCGHLFCWPCLYQWLFLHCDHKECPVCKGEVTEPNIIPIYGRGSSESKVEKNSDGEDGELSLKVPPRPHGQRLESQRQRVRRPLTRRWFGDEMSSWRRIVDEEIRNGSDLQGIFNGSHRRVLTRLRALERPQRVESSDQGLSLGGSGMPRNASELASNPQSGSSHVDGSHGAPRSGSVLRDGIDFWHRVALYNLPASDRIAALTASISNAMERMSSGGSHSGASPLVNSRDPEPSRRQGQQGTPSAADQASGSSTMAVIQGDMGVANSFEEEPDAGPSRAARRRNSAFTALASLDVDGVYPARKRRRTH